MTSICYKEIIKSNLRHNFLPHFALAVLILLLTPVIFGISCLDEKAATVPLEMFVSLTGIILLTPIFLPEQSDDISDVVRSKYTSHLTVWMIRVIYSLTALVILIFGFTLIMRICGSEVTIMNALGALFTAVFLGSLGLFSSGVSRNIAVGYMVPMLYYVVNFAGGNKLGNFYLFSMAQGSFNEKYWLLSGSILVTVILFVILKQRESRE